MKFLVCLMLLFSPLPAHHTGGAASRINAMQQRRAVTKAPLDQIVAAIGTGFGPKVKVATDAEPSYLLGDFNGDGFRDIAVLVRADEAKADLNQLGVKFIDIDPYSRTNGKQLDPLAAMGQNCSGIALIHGTVQGWQTPAAGSTYMFYECFVPFRLVRKGQKIRRGGGSQGPTPVPKGDSIALELETGGSALIYWNGRTYRGFGMRSGD